MSEVNARYAQVYISAIEHELHPAFSRAFSRKTPDARRKQGKSVIDRLTAMPVLDCRTILGGKNKLQAESPYAATFIRIALHLLDASEHATCPEVSQISQSATSNHVQIPAHDPVGRANSASQLCLSLTAKLHPPLE